MRVSPDRETFMRSFNRNFRPHLPEQRDLFEELGPLPDHLRSRIAERLAGQGVAGALGDDEAAN
jgi:hypothetical protein